MNKPHTCPTLPAFAAALCAVAPGASADSAAAAAPGVNPDVVY